MRMNSKEEMIQAYELKRNELNANGDRGRMRGNTKRACLKAAHSASSGIKVVFLFAITIK